MKKICVTKDDVLKEIYSLESVQNYFSKHEDKFLMAEQVREKYFTDKNTVKENIENFASHELGYKIIYEDYDDIYTNKNKVIDTKNKVIFYRILINLKNIHYLDILHLCFHIYKNHKTTHDNEDFIYENKEYVEITEQEAYFLAYEVLRPFKELLAKIAEQYSKQGQFSITDIDYEYSLHNSMILKELGLEKYVVLNIFP